MMNHIELCTYCRKPIILDEPGYGYYYDFLLRVMFHNECFEVAEEIPLETVK
jgi:hypothetical protein